MNEPLSDPDDDVLQKLSGSQGNHILEPSRYERKRVRKDAVFLPKKGKRIILNARGAQRLLLPEQSKDIVALHRRARRLGLRRLQLGLQVGDRIGVFEVLDLACDFSLHLAL